MENMRLFNPQIIHRFYTSWLLNWFSIFAFETDMLASSQQPLTLREISLAEIRVHRCYHYMLQEMEKANLRNCSERWEMKDQWEKILENEMINFGLRSPVSPILSPDLRGDMERSTEAKAWLHHYTWVKLAHLLLM